MNLTRRKALLLGGCAATAGLSGCQIPLLSDQPRVDLHLVNYTSDPQPIQIEILRTDRADRSEAEVFAREFTVPAPEPSESAGAIRRENVVEQRPYLLSVFPKYGTGKSHFHYYPDTASAENELDVRLYREEDGDDVYVRFFM